MRRLLSTMASSTTRRRFAPLKPGSSNSGLPQLKGVVFDMDGTLCEPQSQMFVEMRRTLSIPKTTDILDHITTLPTPEAQANAHASLRAIEQRYMAEQTPQPGLRELMTYLDSRSVPKAICTRNFDIPVQHLLNAFLPESKIWPLVTRDFRPPKPHPAGILHIAEQWGLKDEDGKGDAGGLIMVGDSLDDMAAGRRAGAATVLLANEGNRELESHDDTDFVIEKLDELVQVLEIGFEARERQNY